MGTASSTGVIFAFTLAGSPNTSIWSPIVLFDSPRVSVRGRRKHSQRETLVLPALLSSTPSLRHTATHEQKSKT